MNDQIKDGRKKNFFMLDNDIIDREDFTTNEKIIYIVLCRYADSKETSFPSYETIGKKSGTSRSTAIRVVESLIEKKLIKKKNRKSKSKKENDSNLYTVMSSALPSVSVTLPSISVTPPSVSVTPKEYLLKNTNLERKTTTVKVEPEVKKVVVVSPFATVSTERVKELQKEIKGIINASISVRAIEAMISKKGEDQIYLYLQNWDKFQYQDIKNVSRFFENAVLKPYDIPTTSKGNKKVAQETNYKQRSSDDFAEFARDAELAAYK